MIKKGMGVPDSYPWRWNGRSGYGIGKDNDMMVRQAIDILKRVRSKIPKVIFSNAISHSLHHHAVNGDLSVGRINDFLEVCDYVLIMAYSDRSERIVRICLDELKEGDRNSSIMICVKTSFNKVGGKSTSLYWKGWNNALRSLKYVIEKVRVYPSFRGIAFFEYDGLEKMWEQ